MLSAPLDYRRPQGEKISLMVRELCFPERAGVKQPYLIYLQARGRSTCQSWHSDDETPSPRRGDPGTRALGQWTHLGGLARPWRTSGCC